MFLLKINVFSFPLIFAVMSTIITKHLNFNSVKNEGKSLTPTQSNFDFLKIAPFSNLSLYTKPMD